MVIYVYIETQNGLYTKASLEVISYAKALADKIEDKVIGFTFNPEQPSEILYEYGVSKVLKIQESALKDFQPKAYAQVIFEYFKEQELLFIAPNSNQGSTLAALIATHIKAGLITNVLELPSQTQPLEIKRKAFSGKAVMQVRSTGFKNILTLSPNTFGIKRAPVLGEEDIINFLTPLETLNYLVGSITINENKINLKDAEIVVSGGRGLKSSENWSIIESLATVLGAATAVSKPVSDMGWRPHNEHVGQTGKTIAPKLYIAIGISGAIQHLAGVNASKKIIVINKDPDAPFFKSADYGIIGDAFEIVPKLIEKIKSYKS